MKKITINEAIQSISNDVKNLLLSMQKDVYVIAINNFKLNYIDLYFYAKKPDLFEIYTDSQYEDVQDYKMHLMIDGQLNRKASLLKLYDYNNLTVEVEIP